MIQTTDGQAEKIQFIFLPRNSMLNVYTCIFNLLPRKAKSKSPNGSTKTKFAILCWIVFICLTPSLAVSSDWESCADDLYRLHRAARDASDAATNVKSKANDLKNCKQNSDSYELLEDKCRSKANDYQSAIRTLESELSTINSRVRSASSACGAEMSSLETFQSTPSVPSHV